MEDSSPKICQLPKDLVHQLTFLNHQKSARKLKPKDMPNNEEYGQQDLPQREAKANRQPD